MISIRVKYEDSQVRVFVARGQKRLEDLTWAGEAFRDYTTGTRNPSMMRNQGIVPGPWGAGFTKWAPNTSWVRRVKSDSRVFYKHGRTESSIEEGFRFKMDVKRNKSGGSVGFGLSNVHPATKYLQAGHGGFDVPKGGPGLLAIPFGFGQVVFCRRAHIPPMPARQIEGFREGDAKWFANYTERNYF